jgi:OPA family glycerol-3-phosphate transporter-like MFS transporter
MAAEAMPSHEPLVHHYPRGFRPRRGLNWGFLGLLYTSYYMCRYNLSLANKSISDEFGYTKGQMGNILFAWLLAYAFGQIINGLLTDRIGGKLAMLIGAAGTIVMNILFGAASVWGILGLFIAIRGIDGYLQSFGAPGMTKIKTAWFPKKERGGFAGIFGFMINLGRFGIFTLGPALLAGFTLFGMIHVPPLHWRWLFWVPSAICFLVAIGMYFAVDETPEESGFVGVIPHDPDEGQTGTATHAPLSVVFQKIVCNPAVWIVALAYACTGSVRQIVDQWFPRYMQEVYSTDLQSTQFQFLAFLIPAVASAGSLLSGFVSDKFFAGQRAPVAAVLYAVETVIIVLAAQFHTSNAAVLFFVLIAFTANSTHSILGTAAAMDIGGRKMSGFASGVIDSFQYFGGSLAIWFLSPLLDKSWGYYFYFMVPFGLLGCLLMALGNPIIRRCSQR